MSGKRERKNYTTQINAEADAILGDRNRWKKEEEGRISFTRDTVNDELREEYAPAVIEEVWSRLARYTAATKKTNTIQYHQVPELELIIDEAVAEQYLAAKKQAIATGLVGRS